MKRFTVQSAAFCCLLSASVAADFRPHPRLTLSASEVATIRQHLGRAPLFDQTLAQARDRVAAALAAPIDVPLPKDAQGYTHEKHKSNYQEMHLAGLLYQVTGDRSYADFVKAMLERYARLYPTLGPHPAGSGGGAGRLFWQTLNETMWLVSTSQAYDAIHDTLQPEERARFEEAIFRPMARFFAIEHAKGMDSIHNKGVWMAAAVGMIGYVMGDEELVNKAIHGSKLDDKGGFLAQLDRLFSPDGHYCEGPYYARVALGPGFAFAEIIERHHPSLKIFERRGGILFKALHATLQESTSEGLLLPINDALKERNILTHEIVRAVAVSYIRGGRDATLLDVARRQGSVLLSPAGLEVALALAQNGNPPPYPYRSIELRDGPDGSRGGVGVLRPTGVPDRGMLACLKYSALGMGHGHYDKLHLLYYDQGNDILSDYGAVRFLYIEQKNGGRYLKLNQDYARQTIAHNTLVVDESSNYQGSDEIANKRNSEIHFFDVSKPGFQIMSAKDTTAYPGVVMQRSVALITDPVLEHPLVVDLVTAYADTPHRYDLPFHYQGQFLSASVPLKANLTELRPLGTKAGYQHLWLVAAADAEDGFSITILNADRFYTLTSSAGTGTRVLHTRLGANDPGFDLRNESAFILRREAANLAIATAIEAHGQWDLTREFTRNNFPSVKSVKVLAATDEGSVVRVEHQSGKVWTIMVTNRASDPKASHRLAANGRMFTWTGDSALARE